MMYNVRKINAGEVELKKGSKDQKPKYKQAKNYEELRNIAFYHLGIKDLTIAELRAKIERNTQDSELIQEVIDRLVELGSLKTNEKFIENLTELKAGNHYAKRGIVNELRKRDLPSKLIAEIVPDLYEDLVRDEVEWAWKYLCLNYPDFSGTNKDDVYKTMQRKLGYSSSQIEMALSQHPAIETLRTKLEIKAERLDLSTEIVKLFKKGKGRSVIRMELKFRMLDIDSFDATLSKLELNGDIDFYKKAEELLSKKKYDYSDYSEQSKARAFLARKGFTHDEITEAISNLKNSNTG